MIEDIVFVGAVAQMIGISAYIRAIMKGDVRPNKMSWLMWSIAPLIASFAAIADGVGWAALPVFMSGFAPFCVFLVSLLVRKSHWQLGRFDYICGLFSVLALVLWGLTKDPLIAILFALMSDGFALIPTFLKAWKYPHTEEISTYATGVFNICTSFFAMKTFGFAELAFPIYIFIADSLIIFAICRKKWRCNT